MAVTQMAIKSNVWLTLDDVKDHLKIKLDNTEHDNRVIRLMNMVTDMAERYIQGPIKDRTYVEIKDGDSSNTIVPEYYPCRKVEELRIDANRQFGDATSLIPPVNYILRGTPDPSHPSGIKGESIAVLDDNNSAIFGRIFTGTVIGSIKLTYTAGWGSDMNEIPANLTQAILMGIEYFYILRENRELGVKSKVNNNQQYSRELGLPTEVTEMLDEYVDYTLGHNNQAQRNTFVL